MDDIRCDGLWQGHDGKHCNNSIKCTCECSRCNRTVEDEKFHTCSDPDHQRVAAERHLRTYGRDAQWAVTLGMKILPPNP